MEINIGNLPDSMTDLSKVKKHQYDLLVTEYKKAVMNRHKELTWLGVTYIIPFAHHIIEYLAPKFKGML